MKKKVIVLSIVILLVTSVLLFSAKKKDEMWRKAITEKDLNLRFQYLKEYEAEFGNKKDRFLKFLYLNLADTAFQLKNYDESIQYGEKSLTFEDIDDANKLRIYLSLANAFNITKKDPEKAYHYAGQVIELCESAIQKLGTTEQDPGKKEKQIARFNTFYVAPALRIQVLILYGKGKDNPETLKEAAAKACKAFEADKSKRSSDMVFSLAMNLYKKKQTDAAIQALKVVLDEEKPEYKQSYLLANLYNRKKDKTNAVKYFELAYKAERKPKLALNIGKLVYKQDVNKGMKYFAEAFVLSNSNKQSDAFKYLENLYFNRPDVKSKPPVEQEKGFRAFINAARVRLGKPPITEPLPGPETQQETETTEG
jgi:tetratricopeptide (TPR) repeat protein